MRHFHLLIIAIIVSGISLGNQQTVPVVLETCSEIIKNHSSFVNLTIQYADGQSYSTEIFSRTDLMKGFTQKKILIDTEREIRSCHFNWLLMSNPPHSEYPNPTRLLFPGNKSFKMIQGQCHFGKNAISLSLAPHAIEPFVLRVKESALKSFEARYGLLKVHIHGSGFNYRSYTLKITPRRPQNVWKALLFTKGTVDFTIQSAWRLNNGRLNKVTVNTRDYLVTFK